MRPRIQPKPIKQVILLKTVIYSMEKTITRLMAVDGRVTRVVVRKEEEIECKPQRIFV